MKKPFIGMLSLSSGFSLGDLFITKQVFSYQVYWLHDVTRLLIKVCNYKVFVSFFVFSGYRLL